MKWLISQFMHETNTFSGMPTTEDCFGFNEASAAEVAQHSQGTNTVIGGGLDFALEHAIQVDRILSVEATPGGRVEGGFFQRVKSRIVELSRGVDGVLLSLHGAMVADGFDEADADVLAAVRKQVGPNVPIAVVLDFHANISQQMIDAVDILVGYKTYPHIDCRECGTLAAGLLLRTLRGEIRPKCFFHHPHLLVPVGNTATNREPMLSMMQRARQIETQGQVLAASVFGGFPYADVSHAGMSACVVVDTRAPGAEAHARELSDTLWAQREQLRHEATSVAQAVAQALSEPGGPVVLADVADNPGGGAAGDGVEILRELLAQGVPSAAVGSIWDPKAVDACHQAGLGAEVSIQLGAHGGDPNGSPLTLTGRVTHVGDGSFTFKGPMLTGLKTGMGECAVVRSGGVDVVIAKWRAQNLDPELFRSVGIEPTQRKIVSVKSSIHFRAAYEPIASRIIEVDAPGLMSPDLRKFKFQKVRRPIFVLDEV